MHYAKNIISAENREHAGMRSKLSAFRASGKIPAVNLRAREKNP